jgi:nucleoside-diphosphate-sugar epimerase
VTQETVLVTGAGGFIGSNLVDDQLARGRKVVAVDVNLDRLNHLKENSSCRLAVGDIRDRQLLEELMGGVDIIFHLASAHLEVSKSEDYFREINIDAVKMLLGLAKDKGVRRFVHCSTVGVYGPLEKLPADEQTECHPEILYEETKLQGEQVVRDFVAANAFSAVILRPAWVYGPRCPRTQKLFRTIRKKRFFMVGKGQNMRHPIFISDMLNAFELAATRDGVDGETYLIASNEPVNLRTLVDLIISVQQLDFRPVTVPLPVMVPVCIGVEGVFKLTGKEPPFSTRSLKFFTESSAFDISKARTELGFEPQVQLEDGLARTYEYYKAEGIM